MKIEIKNRWTGVVIFSGDYGSLKEAVEAAVGMGVSLNHASLNYASLDGASLNHASLNCASLKGASLNYASLKGASLDGALLDGALLKGALLKGASLNYASLKGANIDYSCWPLWCGSKGIKVDKRIAAQLAAHFCALECDDPAYKKARKAILDFAMTSHRAGDLGLKGAA